MATWIRIRKEGSFFSRNYGQREKIFIKDTSPTLGILFLFGAILFFPIIINAIVTSSEELGNACFFGGFAILLCLGWSYGAFLRYLSRMPLTIYEKGFTPIHVPIWKGILRKEMFISWDRIESITIEKYQERITTVQRIKLKIKYDRRRKEKISSADMGHQEVVNSLELFMKYNPGKVIDLRAPK